MHHVFLPFYIVFIDMTAEVSTLVAEQVADELLTPESGNFQLTSSILDRTIPFLDIGYEVLTDDVIGTGYGTNCGGSPVVLGVAVRTTAENIISREGSIEIFCGKRKFSTI